MNPTPAKRNFGIVVLATLLLISRAISPLQADDSHEPDAPYRISVDGILVALYRAHTWEPGYVASYGGDYWFCSFDLDGTAKIEVTTKRPLDQLAVLPESSGVKATVTGSKAVMTLTHPGQIVLEPDGKNGPLMLFANPPEKDIPDPNDPLVKYFGPGFHDAGKIELTDNQTLYLAPGAVVQGGIHAQGENITIRGRGVLDGYAYPRFKGPIRYPVTLENCRNVTVEGIVIKDGWSWTFVPGGCDGVRIDNVKLVCARVENGDGIDIVNSRNVTIVNSFVRSDDDCLAPKGMGTRWAGFYDPSYNADKAAMDRGQPVENLRVENCILWSDRAHVWRIGCESVTAAMRNFVFKDIDVLHFPDLWTPDEVPFCISLEPSDDLTQENILFEDLRIRTSGQRGLIDLRPKVTQWAKNPVPGRIRNIIFRNVAFSGPENTTPGRIRVSGPGPQYAVSNVRFENVTRNGKLVVAGSPGVEVLGFTEDITFVNGMDRSKSVVSPLATQPGVTINAAPRNRIFALAEARQARGVIAVQGGDSGPCGAVAKRLQEAVRKAIHVTLPIVDDTKHVFAVVIGDSPQAAAEGLVGEQLPSGAFEIRTVPNQVLIVGNGAGLDRGVDAFLAHFLRFTSAATGEVGTDLIIPPTSLSGAREGLR